MPSRALIRPEDLRRDTVATARALVGCFLCRRFENGEVARLKITEAEAYDGFHDRASHASHGLTPRNAPMFGDAGVWYVYLCYGMHWMLNIVTREKGYPAAVLIRGAGQFNGPAKLTKALAIDKAFNGQRATRASGLWLERGAGAVRVAAAPRIGVDYAGKYWASKKWRFFARVVF